MKKGWLRFLSFSLSIVIFGLATSDCFASPDSEKDESDAKMSGTTWIFSAVNAGSTYTFTETAYRVEYSGVLETFNALPSVMAKVGGVEDYGAGTYSVSGQRVTLKPNGEMHIVINSDGGMEVQYGESFTITLEDDAFVLGSIMYKKVH